MKHKSSRKRTERRTAARKVDATRPRRRPPVFNLAAALLVWLTVALLFYSGRLVRPQSLVLGQTAPETVVATVDFHAETVAATDLRRRAAAGRVLPVFSIAQTGTEQARNALNELIPLIGCLRTADAPEKRSAATDAVNELLANFEIDLQADELLNLVPADPARLEQAVLEAIEPVNTDGIITAAQRRSRFNGTAPGGRLTVLGEQHDVIRNLDSFRTPADALTDAAEAAAAELPAGRQHQTLLRELLAPWVRPNVIYDPAETAARAAQAMDLIDPVIEPVPEGTVLVRSGDTVTPQTLRWLQAHEQRLSDLETPAERLQRMAGSGLMLLLGLMLSAAIAGVVCPALLRDRRSVLLLLTLSLLTLTADKLLLTLSTHQILPPSVLTPLLPLGFAPLLAAVLLGPAAAVCTGLWTALASAILLGGSFEVLLLGLLTTVTAVYTTRDIKRRTALFRAGLWVGAVKIVFVLISAVLNRPSWLVLLPQIGTALLSSFAYALLAIVLIPMFEHLFKVTTDITLLELSDLSHPLLQSLAINAPGTYHHSLMMASLAQNAAEAIGANGLMLRVCAYFHDIGKLVKPEFFTENIQYTENPHDDLAPSMSTLVIISHIKEGVTLAKKYKLPQVVINGIREHQGTGLVSVFYHRAKTKEENENGSAGKINDEDFRYEGPKPQTREMAVLMLADGCEAASRSLEKPTPVRITNLVNSIFDSRLHDGQLDDCNLTLSELKIIRQSFIFTLTNMLHGRVAYPKTDESTEKKKDENPPPQSSDSAPPPPAGDSQTEPGPGR